MISSVVRAHVELHLVRLLYVVLLPTTYMGMQPWMTATTMSITCAMSHVIYLSGDDLLASCATWHAERGRLLVVAGLRLMTIHT